MITEHQKKLIINSTVRKLKGTQVNSFFRLRKNARDICYDLAFRNGIELTDSEADTLSNTIIDRISLTADAGISIQTSEIQADNWLEKKNVEFNYFRRYITYLTIKKSWVDTEALAKDSFKIIQMLGDPTSPHSQHRRGLLIGDVQSGKTGSYTAVMNRAVDIGYNVIVLIAGSLENLRVQTQERIDSELVGYTLNKEIKKKDTYINAGVGCYDIIPRIQVQTTSRRDFSKTMMEKLDSQIHDKTLLYVTKKNVTTLEYIKQALLDHNSDLINTNGKIQGSILVIDDEADNASVNTNSADKNPTRVNASIRSLLNIFENTAYLAVTATPFANIYIDDTLDSEMFGDDLFPSDFIHLLDRPKAYTGALKLYGDYNSDNDTFDYSNCLIPVKEAEIPSNSYRFRHGKEAVNIKTFSDIPASLQKSIRYFLLVQYLMDYTEVGSPHRTMMINISRFVRVQNECAATIKRWLEETLAPNIYTWHNYPAKADDPTTGEYHELKKIWDEYNLEELSGITWSTVSTELYDAVKRVRVCAENMSKYAKSLGRLNYDSWKEGDRVIAVGGQCLSRGLTLENLVVTYFFRNSAAYDTLLQMGRWFGYRNSYLKYFKIWMADESILWYRLISEACEDLRMQIQKMNMLKMEPRKFGLMVRRHPYAGLIITARSKMRNSQKTGRHPVDLNGRLIESPRLWKSNEVNEDNEFAIRDFLANITQPYRFDNKNIVINDVLKKDIAPLIEAFDSAALSIGFCIKDLSDYIIESTGLKWDVVIHQTEGNIASNLIIGNDTIKITAIDRKFMCDDIGVDGKPIIKINDHHVRIGKGNITKLGLTANQIAELEKRYKAQEKEKQWDEIKNTASIWLEAKKEDSNEYRNPLLILYPLHLIDLDTDNPFEFDNPIIWGLGIGFPGEKPHKSEEYYEYYLNPVAMREGAGLSLDKEEEDDDE